jgi:predicted Zn-dependent protease
LVAIASLWLASGTQREKPVLDSEAHASASVRGLEVQVSMNPADAVRRQELAQAYLDAKAPGLAIRVVESAPASARENPALEHVYARALIDQGRSTDALAAEHRVLATCEREASERRCDTWLILSATRRSDILRQLVDLGVDDAQAHPEASAIAYHNATREAKLAVQ